MGPAFPSIKAALETFQAAYDSGDLARAASLHEDIDRLNLTAIDSTGREHRVFNVYFQKGGLLFAAFRAPPRERAAEVKK